MKPVASRLAPLLSLALFAAALWVLHRELTMHPPREIWRAIHAIPRLTLWAAIGLMALGYSFLPLYDAIGLAYVGRRLGLKRTGFVGFVANSFSQTLGFGLLTGGGIRFRIYAAWGLSAAEITQIIAISALTSWSGGLTLAGIGLLTGPVPKSTASVPGPLLGGAFLFVIGGYLVASFLKLGPIRIAGWDVAIPRPKLAVLQVAMATTDWMVAASVLYVLIPPGSHVQFSTFVAVFMLGHLVGVVSHVPGGLGVFETTVLLLLKDNVPTAAILGSLLVFRIIFFIVPFVVALIMFGIYEGTAREGTFARVVRGIGQWLPATAPWALSAVTFIAGAILVFSGAIPTEGSRLIWLARALPLAVIELSHFVGSIAGVGLLILAWGLRRRLDAAYHLTLILLGAGAISSMLTSFNWEEAILFAAIFALLLPAKGQFNREASLTHEPFSTSWFIAVGLVLVSSTWLGVFLYRHVTYSSDLWWKFALRGDAPRFLRATVGVFVVATAFGLARLLRPARRTPVPPTPDDLTRAAAIVRTSSHSMANVALLGDKLLLFNDQQSAFISYAVSGTNWTALGDPVGPPEFASDLVSIFREMTLAHGGHVAFYHVRGERLPLYLDLGLRPVTLGDEAHVPLATFSLAGGAVGWMRRLEAECADEGYRFELLPAERVPAALPALREVSDAWLASAGMRERRFAFGRFDPAYVARFPVAVVRRRERIDAFALLWCAAPGTEVALDLVRWRPGVPKTAVDLLFVESLLWAQAQSYAVFNLGLVPPAVGFEERALGTHWRRLGAVMYPHAGIADPARGLRAHMARFDPTWVPVYLAAPSGLHLPKILTDLTSLIAGGTAIGASE